MKKGYLEKFWNCDHLEEEERKGLKLMDSENNNWNEREGINNMEWIDREEWKRKINF